MKETLEEAKYNAYKEYWNETHTQEVKSNFLTAFELGAKWQQEFNDTSQVTRVEVIQHSEPYNGRVYTNYNAKEVEIQLQDDGKTLKIFLK